MRRSLTILLLALTGLATAPATAQDNAPPNPHLERLDAIAANAEGLTESERLARIVDLSYEYMMAEFPEMATMIGHPTGHDRWTDHSFVAEKRRKGETAHLLFVLDSIDRARLEADDRLDYDLFRDRIAQQVASQRFLSSLMPVNQMAGVQQQPARTLAMMPARRLEHYEWILARLRGVPLLVDQTMARLGRGLARGVTPPRVTLRDVPQQVRNLIPEKALESALLAAFTAIPDSIPAAERERLTAAATEVYTAEIRPAYGRLLRYLEETYIPGARETVAMKDLPDGKAWYGFNVRQSTTTEMRPDEIHELGLAEVERLRAEMDEVIVKTGFSGDFEEFTDFLRTDPRFYFRDAEELLRTYRDIAKRADAELPGLFGSLPRLPYAVTPVPSYAEKSQTTAYYQPGSLELGRPGTFFANTYKLDTRPKWEMEALTLHEAVPGHHLQIALAQELEDVPWFRRLGGYTAFVEGWGLYAESLGEDMGFYRDPYSKFGQLTYEMWRAVRLVVDTGIHALGWSREHAIDFFLENTGKTEHDIVVEVDRYIVWPGQALAYKVGELKLKELRRRSEEALGADFDLRAFHDTVLGAGALPLAVLEARIDEWIVEERGPEVTATPSPVGR